MSGGSFDKNVLDFPRVQFDRVNRVLELSQQMTTFEIQVGNLTLSEQSHYAVAMHRLDGIEVRLKRMEWGARLGGRTNGVIGISGSPP